MSTTTLKYTYSCEDLEYHPSDETKKSLTIMKECVSSISVIHDYANALIPVIYLKVNLTPSVYQSLIADQSNGKLLLQLYCKNIGDSVSNVDKTVINGEFTYYMTDTPDMYQELNSAKDEERSYRSCLIGLIDLNLQTLNRKKLFEGVFVNATPMGLVKMATSELENCIIQPFDYNTAYDNLICPSIPTIAQFIQYLNSKASFYKGSYMYYMDFDKTYLRSYDGSYVEYKEDVAKQIFFNIQYLGLDPNLPTGMVIEDNEYKVNVYGKEVSLHINRSPSQLVSNIFSVYSETGALQTETNDTSETTQVKPDTNKVAVISNTDPNAATVLSKQMQESAVSLIITKLGTDHRLFTPNKEFIVSNYELNPTYTGRYYMKNKKEIYLRVGDHFEGQLLLSLSKCPT